MRPGLARGAVAALEVALRRWKHHSGYHAARLKKPRCRRGALGASGARGEAELAMRGGGGSARGEALGVASYGAERGEGEDGRKRARERALGHRVDLSHSSTSTAQHVAIHTSSNPYERSATEFSF
jgi:hypothetical protein